MGNMLAVRPDTDTKEQVKKRGWVKNAAIIFLAVLVVLTFFSNSIMNRSLPEVATQFTSSGSITARIRGTGTVEAIDSFDVISTLTRTVGEVNVRLGAAVETGDVLVTFTAAESPELETARDALATLLLTYERRVIEAGRGGAFESEQRAIQLARDEITEAQAYLAEIPEPRITEAQTEINAARERTSAAEIRLESAEDTAESARETRAAAASAETDARTSANTARAAIPALERVVRDARDALYAPPGSTLALDRQIEDQMIIVNAKRAEISQAESRWNNAHVLHGNEFRHFVRLAQAEFGGSGDERIWASQNAASLELFAQNQRPIRPIPPDDQSPEEQSRYLIAFDVMMPILIEIRDLNYELIRLELQLARLQQDRQILQGGHTADRNQLVRALNEAEAALGNAMAELATAEAVLREADSVLAIAENAYVAANNAERAARSDLTNEERALSNAEENLVTQQEYRTARETSTAAIRTQQAALENLIFQLSQAQREAGVDNAIDALEMRELRNQIAQKREEVTRLEQDATGAEITSPVSGIVRAINITSGQMTQRDSPLMVIEVVDRGFTLELPVTLEQSRRLVVGDVADVARGWWNAGDINAVLASIRNDPLNPAASRILSFSISGNVESGEQLQLTLAQRSAHYDVIVPNSAIRTDTNGDFVLVVHSRNTPLGNRYIATRADVIILETDDTMTAVTGGLTFGEFIITRSTAPIEPGMQVRLADN